MFVAYLNQKSRKTTWKLLEFEQIDVDKRNKTYKALSVIGSAIDKRYYRISFART